MSILATATWKRRLWHLVRGAVVLAVLLAVAWQMYQRWSQAKAGQLLFRPDWLVAGGVLYLAGWLPAGLWWHRLLHAMGENLPRGAALRAYYIGHLGKYVPGKAMVLVLRAGLLRRHGAHAGAVALAAVYETLATMAVGALLAAAVYATGIVGAGLVPKAAQWTGLAAILLLVAALPLLPGVFSRLVRWLSLPLSRPDAVPVRKLGAGSLASAMVTLSLGWFITGLSLGATLRSVQRVENTPALAVASQEASLPGWSLTQWPLWTASAALATVAGFFAVWLPAGVGVREGVLVELLTPSVGSASAVGAAITWRLVSILSEAALAAVLYFWRRKPRPNSREPKPAD